MVKSSRALKTAIEVLGETARRWVDDRCYRLAASLAYYAIFSLFPLLLLAVTVLGYALGEGSATRNELLDSLTGATGSPAVRALLDETLSSMQAHRTARGVGAVVGLATLAFGASGVFSELSTSLDAIWRVKSGVADTTWQSVLAFLKDKMLSLMLVGVAGVLLLGSLVLSTVLAAVTPSGAGLPWSTIELVASTLLLAVVLATLFRAVPRAPVTWRDVLVGALIAALLLTVLKRLMAWYLAHLGSYAAYGAVGAVLGLMLLIYVSSLVMFFGAELSRVFAERFGSLRGASVARSQA
jgi:membrane protein